MNTSLTVVIFIEILIKNLNMKNCKNLFIFFKINYFKMHVIKKIVLLILKGEEKIKIYKMCLYINVI